MSGYAGQLLGRRYRLVEPVGSGGMAVVWRAADEVLGRDVAVKLLADDLATDESSRARIQAEAQAIAQLSHPNITAIHDYGESPDDGTRYVVMELLAGQLLSTRLRSGPMSWRRSTQIAAQIAAALAAAHHRGIVHRDIKPTNIMLSAAGVKVMDFGVAGLAGSPESDGDETVFGTPAYLAPERLIGNTVLPATDVYALGVLLYRCLTDRLPWDADTPTQMLANHVYEQPLPLPLIEGLPPIVIGLVNRCLAKDPDDRPTAEECARLLAGVTGIHVVLPDTDGVATQEVRVPPGPTLDPDPEPGPRHARPVRRGRRRLYWAAAAIVAVAAGAAGVTIVRGQTGDPPPGCLVTFYIHPDRGPGKFVGRITVVNSGTVTRQPWRVTFTFPGGQRLTEGDGRTQVTQEGSSVVLTGPEALRPGTSVTAGFVGGGGTPGAHPQAFALNGVACRTALDGATDLLPPTSGVTSPPPNVGSQVPGYDQGPGLRPPPGPGGPPPGQNGPPPSPSARDRTPASQGPSLYPNSYDRA